MNRMIMMASSVLVTAAVTAGCGGGPDGASRSESGRTVETALGSVSIPQDIGSVVVLEGRRDLDIVLSLGLPLVGYPVETRQMDLRAPLADELDSVPAASGIFSADEISLEAIAEANPSLIVGRLEDVEPIYDDLLAIAPVIPVGTHEAGQTWQDDLSLVARATGREDKAAELIAEFDDRLEAIGETYGDRIAETTVVPMGYDPDGSEVEAGRMQSVILQQLGARPSTAFADAIASPEGAIEYGSELTFDTYRDAQAILLLLDTDAELAVAESDPLWNRLPAVQAGRVVRSDKNTHEGGPITAHAVLDLVEQLYG